MYISICVKFSHIPALNLCCPIPHFYIRDTKFQTNVMKDTTRKTNLRITRCCAEPEKYINHTMSPFTIQTQNWQATNTEILQITHFAYYVTFLFLAGKTYGTWTRETGCLTFLGRLLSTLHCLGPTTCGTLRIVTN